jgi:hypothetical protein
MGNKTMQESTAHMSIPRACDLLGLTRNELIRQAGKAHLGYRMVPTSKNVRDNMPLPATAQKALRVDRDWVLKRLTQQRGQSSASSKDPATNAKPADGILRFVGAMNHPGNEPIETSRFYGVYRRAASLEEQPDAAQMTTLAELVDPLRTLEDRMGRAQEELFPASS